MTPPVVEDLLRRALVMRRLRAGIAVLLPVEMLLYVPPPHVHSRLDAPRTSVLLIAALLSVIAVSAAVCRRVTDAVALTRWSWVELIADTVIALGVLQVFAFDQYSAIWTILVIVVLEGAFRAGLRGALTLWAASGAVYAVVEVEAGRAFPATAPLDAGSMLFRAALVGVVALVAGQLASSLEAAVERHRHSESALAEQYADLRLIGRVTRAIATGPEARAEVCQAVAELSGAEVVMLYEPSGGELRGTAAAGCPLEALPVLAQHDEVSGTAEAFRTGLRVHRRVARLPALVARAADFPAAAVTSTNFVPVLRDGYPIGVLTLAFQTELAQLPRRVDAALDVLAEEAAVAIARADAAVLLAEQARRDPLTGLVNRRGWEDALQAEMARATRTGAPLAVVMLDLDGLKSFNDTSGHQAGDRLLVATAAGWESKLRPSDLLARYGGDEFVALLPGCAQAPALRVAASLLANMPTGGSCSAGVAEWDGREDGASLVARADAALYEGKRAGGGQVRRAADWAPPPDVDLDAADGAWAFDGVTCLPQPRGGPARSRTGDCPAHLRPRAREA